jgi:uncharacterized protein (DUF2164 family)
MADPADGKSMHIELTDDRRLAILSALRRLFAEEFDEELSEFRAERVLELFVAHLGPAVYNQAIQDARGFLQERLDDLDAVFYEPSPEE